MSRFFEVPFILFGVLQGEAKTHWLWVPVVGVPWFLLYYFSFRYLIRRFDFKTPGREEMSAVSEATVGSQRAETIIQALGGLRSWIAARPVCGSRYGPRNGWTTLCLRKAAPAG